VTPGWAGNVQFTIKNASAQPIIVVMDTERVVRQVAPAETAVFHEACAGDTPTFRVYEQTPDGLRGSLRATERYPTVIGPPPLRIGGRDLEWDGRRLRESE
jgi:hypothetical protein